MLEQMQTAVKTAQSCPESNVFDWIAYRQRSAHRFNAINDGKLHEIDGIRCEKCRNRGYTAYVDAAGAEYSMRCKCMDKRAAIANIKRSGLSDLLTRYTFADFKTETPWHAAMMSSAQAFLEDSQNGNHWLYIGGQVGSGKTHICTAVCSQLLDAGHEVVYMLWRDESTRLKAIVNEPDEYARLINKYKAAEVLYIDDLFKIKRGAGSQPTTGDINLAFELLNARYNDISKRTIISSEWLIDELRDIDEGIASRIYERSKACCTEVSRDERKNYRLAGGMTR